MSGPHRRAAVSALILSHAVLILLLAPGTAWALTGDVTPVSDLLADGSQRNGQIVTVEGELVGDYGFRKDGYMWTQLNDDSYARTAVVDGGRLTGSNVGIGVRMPSDLARDLDPVGGYRLEGPVIMATGVWRFHDPERGGESYLDVESFIVTKNGRRLEEGPDWFAFSTGVVLLATAVVLKVRRKHGE